MTTNPKLIAARTWAEGIEQLCYDQGLDIEVHIALSPMLDKWSYTWRPSFPGDPNVDHLDPWYAMELGKRIHLQFHQILLAADGTRPPEVIPSPMLQDLIDGNDGFGNPRGG